MKISEAGIDLIRSFEGYEEKLPGGSCRAYLDTLTDPPVWTIAWGITNGVTEGMVLTRDEAEVKFRAEIAKFDAAVDRLVTVELNQNEHDALVSFAYNIGIEEFERSTLLKKLNQGDLCGAAAEFKRWNKSGGKVYEGLINRRMREEALFLTPIGSGA